MSVCLSVCLLLTRKPHYRTSPIFSACYLWHWLSPPLMACDTLRTSSFTDDVMFSYYGANGPESSKTLFRRSRQVAVPVGRHTTTVLG